MKEEEILKKLGIEAEDFRLVFGRSKIDYDESKEEINRKQHKYSLESAVYLLERWLLPIESPPFITRKVEKSDETRHEHMGVDDEGNIVFIVTTMRPDETVRVISFRRASKEEGKLFIELTGYNLSLERDRS